MSFDINKFVKLPSFLVFVGIALAAVMFYLVDAHGFVGHLAKGIGVLGLFIALAGFVYEKIYVAMILAVLLLAPGLRAQTVPSVLLTWDPSTSSSPTNPGNYGVYRAVSTAGVCGTFTRISVAPATSFTDAKVAGGVSYCYYVTFIYTPSGTPNSIETAVADLDPTDQITVGPIPGIVVPPPPTFRAASPKNLVGTIQ